MDSRNLMYFSEAQSAYKKFLKSSGEFWDWILKNRKIWKSFAEVQKEENAYNSVNLGIKEIPLGKIVGSVEKIFVFLIKILFLKIIL